MPIGGPISAIVALPAKVADVQIPAIVANAGQSHRSPSLDHRN
jgi:hypothetical protein